MIVFDCGANMGYESQEYLNKWPEATLYCIEPCLELYYNYLIKKFANDSRVKLLPIAIDKKNGFRKFNIAGQNDWGCSSLYDFAEISPLWGERPDFKVTHSYIVPTFTLKTICNIYNIDKIDYLHIDTQGNDFVVLKSLEEKIKILEAGKCEAAYLTDLYKDTDNSYISITKFLEENGFKTTIVPHAHLCECDIYFERKQQ